MSSKQQIETPRLWLDQFLVEEHDLAEAEDRRVFGNSIPEPAFIKFWMILKGQALMLGELQLRFHLRLLSLPSRRHPRLEAISTVQRSRQVLAITMVAAIWWNSRSNRENRSCNAAARLSALSPTLN